MKVEAVALDNTLENLIACTVILRQDHLLVFCVVLNRILTFHPEVTFHSECLIPWYL